MGIFGDKFYLHEKGNDHVNMKVLILILNLLFDSAMIIIKIGFPL